MRFISSTSDGVTVETDDGSIVFYPYGVTMPGKVISGPKKNNSSSETTTD